MTVLQFKRRSEETPGGSSDDWDESIVLRIHYRKGEMCGAELQDLPIGAHALDTDPEAIGRYLRDIAQSYMYLLCDFSRATYGDNEHPDTTTAFLAAGLTNGVACVYSYEPFNTPERSEWLWERLKSIHGTILGHFRDRVIEQEPEQLSLFPELPLDVG